MLITGKETSVTITGQAADKLISAGSGDAALLYIHILRCGGETDPAQAAKELNFSASQVEKAVSVLQSLGLVRGAGDSVPEEYTGRDITDNLASREDFRSVTREAERLMGRPLSESDLRRLLTVYDRMGLEAEAMVLLITHCCQEYAGKYGAGRVPTVGYVEKAAKTWCENGVRTADDAEAYLKRRAKLKEDITLAAKALGIAQRTLAPTERRFLESWLELGFSPQVIEKAYDITVLRTGSLAWKYMDAVLRSWHAKGLMTPESIDSGDGKKPAKVTAGSSDHELEAVRWLQNRKKQRE